nr:suppressor of RNA silencing [Sweet potato chlorotic stunt virus]QYA73032.1 suppressor of RNA silencing [Sweet potato chlorotic stunt virus]QYA73064.1 suppressor of RNA silencing [Sweet potato chlorotic stunt virus]QYA73105.1 suppressor of RNA silencing [Sweet potato chlorotic stunt virus]QYA73127.1 suppressor of RNA silencing [Sweet potato chlorotic stunt virus]
MMIPIYSDVSEESKLTIFGSRHRLDSIIQSICTSEDRDKYEILGDWAITTYVTSMLTDLFKHDADAESLSLLRAHNISNFMFAKVMVESRFYEDFSIWLTPDQLQLCRMTFGGGKNVYEVNVKFLANYFERVVGWLVINDSSESIKMFLDLFLKPLMSFRIKKPARSILQEWAVKNNKRLDIYTGEYNVNNVVYVLVDGKEISRANDLISKKRAISKAVNFAVEALNLN